MTSSTVRGHLRGLEVLRALNQQNYSTALQLSRATNLPRATVYRLLSTLVSAGLVSQPNGGEHYCLSHAVLGLAEGFDERAQAVESARSIAERLSEEIGWPAYLHVFEDGAMAARHIVRSPRELSVPRLGGRVPLLASSPGRAYLASLSAEDRHSVLEKLLADPRNQTAEIGSVREAERLLGDVTTYGCGFRDQGLVPRTCSFSVPISVDGHAAAFLTLVVMRAVMSVNRAIDSHLPAARAAAAEVERVLESVRKPSAPRRF